MATTYYILYIPGLADRLNRTAILQGGAIKLWRMSRHVHVHYFVAGWKDKDESFAHKVTRLTNEIDHATSKGYRVALVAASAGSGLALAAFAKRRDTIHAVISICGKLRHPETIPAPLFAVNPAFRQAIVSFAHTDQKLTPTDRRKILVVKAGHDSYVPLRDGSIAGAHIYRMASAGHVTSILMALTIYRRKLIRFIKRTNIEHSTKT